MSRKIKPLGFNFEVNEERLRELLFKELELDFIKRARVINDGGYEDVRKDFIEEANKEHGLNFYKEDWIEFLEYMVEVKLAGIIMKKDSDQAKKLENNN